MGYRSDVAFALPKEEAVKLYKLFEEQSLYNLLDHNEALDSLSIDKTEIEFCGTTWCIFYWEYLKWYRSYPEVNIIVNYMEQDNSQYCFARLGEELDDITFEHNNDEDENIFRMLRSIELDY